MLTKGQILRTKILDIHYDGSGVAKIDNTTVFVEKAITDDDVTIEIFKTKGTIAYAKIVMIHQESTHRTQALCQHFGTCSGCTWQHANMELQKAHRRSQLVQLFNTANISITHIVIEEAYLNAYQYRRKARLSVKFDNKKNIVYVGFREQNPRKIANIQNCRVLLEPKWPKLWQEVIQNLECKNMIPQLEYIEGQHETAFTLRVLSNLNIQDLNILNAFRKLHNIRIFIQASSALKVIELNDDIETTISKIKYKDYSIEPKIEYKALNFTLTAGAFDFMQINPLVADWMINKAIEWTNPQKSDYVIDLFCGLGPFTLNFAKYAKHVHGIELEQAMVDKAKKHLEILNIKNANFSKADLFKEEALVCPCDILIVDPPRSGMALLTEWANSTAAQCILYVSCHAATMVRDIAPLLNNNTYTIEKIAIMDMFAQTKHAETMILLRRNL